MERDVNSQQFLAHRNLPEQGAPVLNGDQTLALQEPLQLPGTAQERARQRFRQRAAIGFLAGLCIVGLLSVLRLTAQDGLADDHPNAFGPSSPVFQGWGKPAVALVLSGQSHGYLQPCGCSEPQFGGLVRRYNFLHSLKQKGWPVVALDLGDVAQPKSNPQLTLKYSTAMKALQVMGYSAVGVGRTEMSIPLFGAIGAHRLNNPFPKMLSATLDHPKTLQVIREFVDGSSVIPPEKKGQPTVGVFALLSPMVFKKVNDTDLFLRDDNREVVLQELTRLQKEKAQVVVLLYQGSTEEARKAAEFCAAERQKNPALPRLDVILCLSPESEPPAVPEQVKGVSTLIINVGHNGRYVGVVGAFPTGQPAQPYEFKYQLVSIGPPFDTPKGQEPKHPVMRLMEDYTREVKDGEYLLKFPTSLHPVQIGFPDAKYVGSERCASCHPHAYDIWEKTGHAHAYDTLVDVKHPSLRQHDGECIVCHVVGFKHPTGYGDALRTKDLKMVNRLKHVGCESCHGPGSEHVKDRHNEQLYQLMNPWRPSAEELDPKTPAARAEELKVIRLRKVDKFCQECHDIDNDVHWNFAKKWPQVIHPTPKKAAAQQPAAPVNPAPLNALPLNPMPLQPAPVGLPAPQPMANPPETEPRFFQKLLKKIRQN